MGINIPPLKERTEDVPALVDHFVKVYSAQLNKPIRGIDKEVMDAFMEYDWKGNVRELENTIERAMILCDGNTLTLEQFPHLDPKSKETSNLEKDLKSSVKKFEQDTILRALELANNDKSEAARSLGLSLSSLYRKISELGIELKE